MPEASGHLHIITGGALDPVHGLVGKTNDFFLVGRVGGEAGDTKARGNFNRQTFGVEKDPLLDKLANSLGNPEGLVLGRLRQQDDEFVSAIPGGNVELSEPLANLLADFLEKPGSDEVAVLVVDPFEEIKVHEDERELKTVPP